MGRRAVALIVTLALGPFVAPLPAGAQQPATARRIGFLGSSGATAAPQVVEAFRQGLRELGYVEGQNIAIEYRWAEGRYERLPALAAELVRLKVDVIVTVCAGGPGCPASDQDDPYCDGGRC